MLVWQIRFSCSANGSWIFELMRINIYKFILRAVNKLVLSIIPGMGFENIAEIEGGIVAWKTRCTDW